MAKAQDTPFGKQPGLEQRLAQLARDEHECCRFFAFDLRTTAEHVVWETRAAAEADPLLDEWVRLPERLAAEAPAQESPALKRAFNAAGLTFAADSEREKARR